MRPKPESMQIDWSKLWLLQHYKAASRPRVIDSQPIVRLRDGEVVLFKRAGSARWQCRYKLPELGWIHRATGTASLEDAVCVACDLYDEARFRSRLGLAPESKRVSDIAKRCVTDMETAMQSGVGKRVFADYCSVIKQYFIPFFGNKHLHKLSAAEISEFEAWRNLKMQRVPATSTLLTFAAAWARLHDTAIQHGWISAHTPVPRMTVQGGIKAQSRPAFRAEEVEKLRTFMATWSTRGARQRTQEMQLLLRDYVELLLFTGIRHGTEAMRLRWKHLEWHIAEERRFLRIWVSGKTGERWLIAKSPAVEVLGRLVARDTVLREVALDDILGARHDKLLFAFSDGTQPYHFNAAFQRLLTQANLLKDASGQNRTLYSLRHTYATQELLAGTDIHTLAKQMGTSVLMLERFYSKLTATAAAHELG